MSEIRIHRKSDHKNIVKFEHVFEDDDNVYILLEVCKKKSLAEELKEKKIVSDDRVRELVR
jgi:serine/threonine protein kinase